MLTEVYIEALLVDEDAADAVCQAWNARELNNAGACIAWTLIIRQAVLDCIETNDCFALRVQLIDATQALNLSASVSRSNVCTKSRSYRPAPLVYAPGLGARRNDCIWP